MSLDVYLTMKGVQNLDNSSGIFIREEGQIKELTREEWDERFPDREPVIVKMPSDSEEVYSENITHNLSGMAEDAGLYKCLLHPGEIDITKAKQLIEPLQNGLILLENEPERFKKFNPENGWGSYEGLVRFVKDYLEACKQYPEASVHASI